MDLCRFYKDCKAASVIRHINEFYDLSQRKSMIFGDCVTFDGQYLPARCVNEDRQKRCLYFLRYSRLASLNQNP